MAATWQPRQLSSTWGSGKYSSSLANQIPANHGEEKQRTRTRLVAAFHDGKWQVADDPQPGASGNGGSFIPPFADAIAERFKVPIGIVAAGVGATSIREWLPRGTQFPNPPTLTRNVRQLPSGQWESKGSYL